MPVHQPARAPSGCGFCKRNKEPESIYRGHQLKDEAGQVTCPQLFKYRCELCGSTGPEAHTRSYCPQLAAFKTLQVEARPPASADSHHQHRRPAQEGLCLGNSRLFRNMGSVTNSRYNSAGHLRSGRQPSAHQQQPARALAHRQQPATLDGGRPGLGSNPTAGQLERLHQRGFPPFG